MPIPEDNSRELISMDARLSAVHQQYITTKLVQVDRLLVQHDQEIAVLGVILLGVCGLLAYTQYQIRRIENGDTKESSGRVRHNKGSSD